MIWLVIAVLAIVFMTVIFKKIEDEIGFYFLFILLSICSIIILIICVIATGSVLSYQASLIEVERNIVVAQEQFDAIKKTIETYSAKYPLEENLIRSFNPEILLSVPQIKSDSFLTSQISLAVECQNKIYELRMKGNGYKQALDFHKHRWFSPTLASPKYN